jgi:hypothetical protein
VGKKERDERDATAFISCKQSHCGKIHSTGESGADVVFPHVVYAVFLQKMRVLSPVQIFDQKIENYFIC